MVLGIPEQKMTKVPLAAPTWITESPSDAPLSEAVAQAIPERFALYVGGYAARKNVPLLMQVCGEVWRRDNTFRCVFAGISEEGVKNHQDLPMVWQSEDVRSASVLLPEVSNADLAPLYRRSSFAIYPSLSEGFGLPLVEAAACGCLCLCGDNSSMREIQTNHEMRVTSTDSVRWSERILQLWRNPPSATEIKENCTQIVTRYSWEEAAHSILRVFEINARNNDTQRG
jgi:glycosyltransferase involved in cell wall biosynthesis